MTATTMSATIIQPEGSVDTMTLPRDDDKRLAILQQVVGGYIEAVALPGGRYMVINENGKDAPHVVNQTATDIAREAQAIQPDDYIAGVAAIITQGVLQ
jgi:hypothetical protein